MNDRESRRQPNAPERPVDHGDFMRQKEREVAENTKENLRNLKQQMNRMTLGARKQGDRLSLRQERFENMVEKKLKEEQAPFLKKLEELFASYDNSQDYNEFLEKVRKLTEEAKQNVTKLQQAIMYSVKCLAGYDGIIEAEDYAYMYTILDNVSELYGKDVKLVDLLSNIQKENLTTSDWDAICANIKSKSLTRTKNSEVDSLKLSTSAFLVQMMSPDLRTNLLIEFKKRHGIDHATELAGQMVRTNLISLKQHEFVMKEISQAEYIRTEEEEKDIMEQRRQMEMLTKNIRENLKSPMAINAAERLLNRNSLGSLLITGIGVMGMITNYMGGLSEGKGIGRFLKGFKNPYFLFSGGVAAGGYHMLTGSMHPGKSVGALDNISRKTRALESFFGSDNLAATQDSQMKVLAEICANHKPMEDMLLDRQAKGFDDIWSFYETKRFNSEVLKSGLITSDQREQMKSGKKGLYDEFLEHVEGKGNQRGAIKLKEAKRRYGQAAVERMIFDTTVAAYSLGIKTTEGFYTQKTYNNVKYHDIFLYRQGVKSRPVVQAQTT